MTYFLDSNGDLIGQIGFALNTKKHTQSKFIELERHARKAYIETREKLFAKELNVKTCRIRKEETQSISIRLDQYVVKSIQIDKYNNLSCKIPKPIPLQYLEKFRRLFNEFIEHQGSYYHRTGTGFFINYYRQQETDVDTIDAMCIIDDVDSEHPDHNFRTWLVENKRG